MGKLVTAAEARAIQKQNNTESYLSEVMDAVMEVICDPNNYATQVDCTAIKEARPDADHAAVAAILRDENQYTITVTAESVFVSWAE